MLEADASWWSLEVAVGESERNPGGQRTELCGVSWGGP